MKNDATQMRAPNAREIMTQKPDTLLPDTLVPIAIHQILSRRLSEIPIVEESGKYCGMFSEKCCMRVLASISELIDVRESNPLKASDVMIPIHKLFALAAEDDVFDAMSGLLKQGFSGAPVIDLMGRFQGVFSEKTCLGFVIEAAYSGTPPGQVGQFIDQDSNRLIDADTDLHTIAEVFVETTYGRLPVMRGEQVIGQISRRDLLNSSEILASIMKHHLNKPRTERESRLPRADTHLATFGKLSDHSVSAFADTKSRHIAPDMDLFSVAQLFFNSPCRRFAVLEAGKLIGQLTRCDVLRHAIALLKK